MGKTATAAMAAVLVVGMAGQARADSSIMDLSPLVGNVDGIAGAELIFPQMSQINDGFNFSFKVFRPDTPQTNNAKALYQTVAKPVKYPASPCTTSDWEDREESWKFLRSGSYLVAGISLKRSCRDSTSGEDREAYKTSIYIVDASSGSGVPAMLTYPSELAGLNLTEDLNDAGSSQDLMITTMADGNARVDVRDFVSGTTYSVNKVVIFK